MCLYDHSSVNVSYLSIGHCVTDDLPLLCFPTGLWCCLSILSKSGQALQLGTIRRGTQTDEKEDPICDKSSLVFSCVYTWTSSINFGTFFEIDCTHEIYAGLLQYCLYSCNFIFCKGCHPVEISRSCLEKNCKLATRVIDQQQCSVSLPRQRHHFVECCVSVLPHI